MDRFELQRKEFVAADAFSKALKRHNCTAIVDDDYPEVRYVYEGALANLLAAMHGNGRFCPGNRYGLTSTALPVAGGYDPAVVKELVEAAKEARIALHSCIDALSSDEESDHERLAALEVALARVGGAA
ncbi:MAG: hypothetical protein ACYC0F_05335 [Rhodanobacter sp.]